MDVRFPGFLDVTLVNTIQDMLDQFSDEVSDNTKQPNNPSRTYVRDTKAMARTPADIKDISNAYQYIVDMPGIKPSDVKVHLENDNGNVLVVSGERRRDKEKDEKEGVKYVSMERRMGKFMRKFVLPENANVDNINAVCRDGVLIVTVEKLPPPGAKKLKTIEVKSV